MALALFRSYVLLIVLCIVITLTDKSQGDTIPGGCKLVLGRNNHIELPSKFIVSVLNNDKDKTNDIQIDKTNDIQIDKTNDIQIVNLPEGSFVTVPDGFEVPIEHLDYNTENCEIHISDDLTVSPTEELKKSMDGVLKAKDLREIMFLDTSFDGYIDITIQDAHSYEIAIEVTLPRCIIVLPQNNSVVLPKGCTINAPKNRFSGALVLPTNWLRKTEDGGRIMNLPRGFTVTIPPGFKVGPSKGCYGFPPVGWFSHNLVGDLIINLPLGWIVEPTKELKTIQKDLSVEVLEKKKSEL